MPGRVRRRRLQLLQVGQSPKRHGRNLRSGRVSRHLPDVGEQGIDVGIGNRP
jgi:hypothetical protein